MTDIFKNQPTYLTREEFRDFKEGDFKELRLDVKDLRGDVTELRRNVNELRSDVNELRGDVDELSEEVTELQQFTRDGFVKMDELITNTKIEIISTISKKIDESKVELKGEFERIADLQSKRTVECLLVALDENYNTRKY